MDSDERTKETPDVSPGRTSFNDLSPEQVVRAERDILGRCQSCGATMAFYAAPIHLACEQLPPKPRLLLLGVYDTPSFFQAQPNLGYPLPGFDEYIKNWSILGDHFWFDWQPSDGQPVTEAAVSMVAVDQLTPTSLVEQRQRLSTQYQVVAANVLALQVVGAHQGKAGFFLSHWFSPGSLLSYLQTIFTPADYQVTRTSFPKGSLYAIRRHCVPSEGVVTMLNNVLGNILPKERQLTLQAIKAII